MCLCVCVAEELELNVVGAPVDEEDQHLWSSGELKYYSRAELKTSDHRYSNTRPLVVIFRNVRGAQCFISRTCKYTKYFCCVFFFYHDICSHVGALCLLKICLFIFLA